MRAVVQTGYGAPSQVLEIRELEPPAVGERQALVRVRAASVHPDVWHVVTGFPRALRMMGSGLRRPKEVVPGTDVAGEIESVGSLVTRFEPGDEVFGETIRGMQWRNGGAYAEYVAVNEDALALKPAKVAFEQAATVPTSGMIALHNLSALQPGADGQRVLVNGAGGGVGAVAVQVARSLGAHVTAVDHTHKLDLLRTLGADQVVDYTTDDATRAGDRFDLVFDVVGNHSFSAYRRVLAADGTYVLIGHDQFGTRGRRLLGTIPRMLSLMARSAVEPRLPRPVGPPDRRQSMARLHDLLEDGSLAPIVARTFPLEQVPDAIALLASGRALGRIVIVP